MTEHDPIIVGPESSYTGRYAIEAEPGRLAAHNAASWSVIDAMINAYGPRDFWDLAVAVRGHRHEGKFTGRPQNFVAYCIRSGWLRKVG
ncbi:MAG: hypothetical protein ABJ308_07255 [Halieaceae bacterium]